MQWFDPRRLRHRRSCRRVWKRLSHNRIQIRCAWQHGVYWNRSPQHSHIFTLVDHRKINLWFDLFRSWWRSTIYDDSISNLTGQFCFRWLCVAGVFLMKKINLIGHKFGKLSVIDQRGKLNGKERLWVCQCSCGNLINALSYNLKSGSSRSCGCIRHESKNYHGMIGSKIYSAWKDMKRRCLNSKAVEFKNYGGRGIKLCSR